MYGWFFKVENNSLELTRIFKESFKDQRWAWEKSVRAEKRDRDAERERERERDVSASTPSSVDMYGCMTTLSKSPDDVLSADIGVLLLDVGCF